ncbi:MAG: addiction module protein [Gammaproteobacteria bacterium]|nr:addiction module protein [Gammaproteobacteria bacterium]
MGKDIHQLQAEARQLPAQDRARLARWLIASLDAGEWAASGQPWRTEAHERPATPRHTTTAGLHDNEALATLLKSV